MAHSDVTDTSRSSWTAYDGQLIAWNLEYHGAWVVTKNTLGNKNK